MTNRRSQKTSPADHGDGEVSVPALLKESSRAIRESRILLARLRRSGALRPPPQAWSCRTGLKGLPGNTRGAAPLHLPPARSVERYPIVGQHLTPVALVLTYNVGRVSWTGSLTMSERTRKEDDRKARLRKLTESRGSSSVEDLLASSDEVIRRSRELLARVLGSASVIPDDDGGKEGGR